MRLLPLLALLTAVTPAQPTGSAQVHAFAGVNAGEGPEIGGNAHASFGAGLGIAIRPKLAITGSYAFNRIASIDDQVCLPGSCITVNASVQIHEVLFGARVKGPADMRVAPYAAAYAGFVRATASGLTGEFSLDASETKPAVATGGGLDVRLGRNYGLLVDVRVVKPADIRWYARVTGGLFYNFGQ